jgi:2'-5' RNA ligase
MSRRRRPRNTRDNRNNGYAQQAQSQAAQFPASARASRPVPLGAAYRPIQTSSYNQPGASQWSGVNDQPVSAYENPTGQNQANQNVSTVAFPPGDPLHPVPGYNVRQWMYPVGGNITPQARATEMTSFETLRNLASLYDVIGLCELAHFRIIERLSLTIKPRQALLDAGEDQTADKWTKPARQMEEWFADGPDKRGGDLTSWMIAVMKDLLEIDAVGVINRPTRDGRLHSLDLVAGDTLKCLWDAEGRTPLAPVPAFQQIAYGAPGALFTVAGARMDGTEIDYLKIVNRTNSMYGESPVERIILTVNSALRKQHYDLTRFTDGTTPEGVIQTSDPALLTMTVDQVAAWEEMWNSALAGNNALRHRTKFVPPGFTFTSTEQSAIATEFDEMLLNKTVSAFGLTKDELGFTDTSNRSVGQSQENVTYRQAIMPRSSRLAAYFTKIIRRYDGTPLSVTARTVSRPGAPTRDTGNWDARFFCDWEGIEEPEDFTAKTNAYATLVGAGIVGRTEAKRALGLPIAKGEVEIPGMILAPAGPDSMVILEDLVAQREQINKAHKAALDSKIAGAQAAEEQFKSGGNPVMAAGMGAGNVNAGAKQQIAAGGAPGGQQAPQQSPARPARQNTGGQGRQLAQRTDSGNARTDASEFEEREDDDETDTEYAGPGDTHRADAGSEPAGRRHLARAGEHAVGRAHADTGRGDGGRGADSDDAGRRTDGGMGASVERGTRASSSSQDDIFATRPSTGRDAARLRDDGDATGSRVRESAADHGGLRGVGRGGDRVAVRGGQSLSTSAPPVDGAERGSGDRIARDDAASRDSNARSQATSQAGPEADRENISREWARYRECALKDAKKGRAPRPFVSDVLPSTLHVWVEERLSGVTSADAVRAVFAEAREREERVTTNGAEHTGVMIALFLTTEAAQTLALPGGEPPSEMHVTLAYLGEAADWNAQQRARLRDCLARFASTHHLSGGGHTGDLDRFNVSEEGKYPLIAHVEMPGLGAFRAELVKELVRNGLPYDTTHPNYVPHITLAWVQDGAKPPVQSIAPVLLRFDTVWLAMGDERTSFPLQNEIRSEPSPAHSDPLAALAQAMLSRLEATALTEQRASLADLRTQVNAALRY